MGETSAISRCWSSHVPALSADFACKAMLRRIGWEVSEDKATPFANEMSALGVNFLFGQALEGV
eukprot:3807627-Amphidinium_carterae.1